MTDTRPGYDVPVPVIVGGIFVLSALFGLGFSIMFRKPGSGGLHGAQNPWSPAATARFKQRGS